MVSYALGDSICILKKNIIKQIKNKMQKTYKKENRKDKIKIENKK